MITCLNLFFVLSHAFADTTPERIDSFSTRDLGLTEIVTRVPGSSWGVLKTSFSRDAIPGWAAMLSATAALYHYDQVLFEGAQNTGRRWGLSQEEHTKTAIELSGHSLLRLPSDTSSTLYFLGDGLIPVVIAVGLTADGYIAKSQRARNTGIKMLHGLTLTLIFDQTLKRVFGRESPSAATQDRGTFHLFPNLGEYSRNVSHYDAMPSGHIMTSVLGFTVLRESYPEYDKFLFPFEVAWIGALGFAMMNNAVHWASDYPLAIALGVVIGKEASRMDRVESSGLVSKEKTEVGSWKWLPAPVPGGGALFAIKSF